MAIKKLSADYWKDVERQSRLETKEIAKGAAITPKQFREILNKQFGLQSGHDGSNRTGWNAQSGARTRSYGDWLYASDRTMFNVDYLRYLKGELWF